MSKGVTGAVQECVEGAAALVARSRRERGAIVEGDRGDEGLETELVEEDVFAGIVLGHVEQDQIRLPCLVRFRRFV